MNKMTKLVIKDADGKIVGYWVAKTARGFSKAQKQEIAATREWFQIKA